MSRRQASLSNALAMSIEANCVSFDAATCGCTASDDAKSRNA